MDYFFILIGLTGLLLGGDALVRGSCSIALRLSLSPFVIGLTVVGFGTSAPELLVSVQAALSGVPDIAIGNILGSNIANILLIVGAAALVWPITSTTPAPRRDLTFVVCCAVVLVPIFAMGSVSRLMGFSLLAVLAVYLILTFMRPGPSEPLDVPDEAPKLGKSLLQLALGFGALLVGARLLVDGAVSVARDFNISEAFIGLTIVAVGTSLPELATSLIAAFRRQSDIAIGNILGSNIFNVTAVLGVTAMIAPIPVAARFAALDLPVMIAVSVLLAVLLLLRGGIGRSVGALMLVGYVAYVMVAS